MKNQAEVFADAGNDPKYHQEPAKATDWLSTLFVANQVSVGVATECWILR